MSIDAVRACLKPYGLDDRIHEFEESSATVDLAAKAIGCEPKEIVKTLSFHVGDEVILIASAGDVRIDNRKFKDCFKTKAKMLKPEETEELVGHAIGGVCPFGLKDGVSLYLDASIKSLTNVYPAAGSTNSAVYLTVDELDRATQPHEWIDVCSS